ATRPLPPARGDKRTQSGRREFVIAKTEEQAGDELWLEWNGRWHRWILRPDRKKERRWIALPAGDFSTAAPLKGATFEERGTYELIEGSDAQRRFDLWFTGKALDGEWILEKIAHRSWTSARPRCLHHSPLRHRVRIVERDVLQRVIPPRRAA